MYNLWTDEKEGEYLRAKGASAVRAERTKTLKAVAEWLGKLDREGMGEWVYIKDSDEELLREGKMPGEG